MTADLRRAPGPCTGRLRRPHRLVDVMDWPGLPVDPLAQAWEQILAAVLAEGPPEDP